MLKGDLGGIYSPLFYLTLPQNIKFGKRLRDIADINLTRNKPKFSGEELVPYVGLPETDEHDNDVKTVLERPFSEVGSRSLILKNDILFARIEPSIFNKKYIYVDDLKGFGYAFTSTEFYILKAKSVLQKYLFYILFLDFFYNQVEGKTTGSTGRRRLDKGAFENIIIPSPPLEIQQKIINIFEKAYDVKKEKEAQAKALLASIDNYLLTELGITLPDKQENSLKNRVFLRNISGVSGERFDAGFYQKYFIGVLQNIENGIFKCYPIHENAKFISGFAFKSEDYVESSDCYLITIKNIIANSIDLTKSTFLPNHYFKLYQNFRVKENDLVIAMTGATIGKVGIFNETKQALLNQRNGIIYSDKIDSIFLMSLLNLDLFQSLILRNSNGGTQPNISETDIMKIRIPFPPLEIQEKIVNHIQSIRDKAKALENEAKEILEKAKVEVEKMILGE